MTKKQPVALRLASWLDGTLGDLWPSYIPQEAGAELRRQHARITELEARLEIDPRHSYDGIACRDATIAELEAVSESKADLIDSLTSLLSLINRDAPHLSGKVVGTALEAVQTAALTQPAQYLQQSAEATKDAARYRLLRERVGSTLTGELYLYVSSREEVRASMQDLMAQLDANIDAAIATQAAKGDV